MQDDDGEAQGVLSGYRPEHSPAARSLGGTTAAVLLSGAGSRGSHDRLARHESRPKQAGGGYVAPSAAAQRKHDHDRVGLTRGLCCGNADRGVSVELAEARSAAWVGVPVAQVLDGRVSFPRGGNLLCLPVTVRLKAVTFVDSARSGADDRRDLGVRVVVLSEEDATGFVGPGAPAFGEHA